MSTIPSSRKINMEVWLSGLRRYIGNVVARLCGSVGSNPTTSSKIVEVPKNYTYNRSYGMEFEPIIWVESHITEWLEANAESVVSHGYDHKKRGYMVEFNDDETAIQFKLTFPVDE